jgi:hypothetical protein
MTSLNANDIAVSEELRTFTFFPKLPLKLRLKI